MKNKISKPFCFTIDQLQHHNQKTNLNPSRKEVFLQQTDEMLLCYNIFPLHDPVKRFWKTSEHNTDQYTISPYDIKMIFNRLHVLRIMITISWVTKFIIVLREETATKLSETLNNGSNKLEEGINDMANIKEALMDKLEEHWNGLKRWFF